MRNRMRYETSVSLIYFLSRLLEFVLVVGNRSMIFLKVIIVTN